MTSQINLFFFLLLSLILRQSIHLQADSIILKAKNRDIWVNGKKSQVYEIAQPNGMQGLFLQKGERFEVVVENQIDQPTGVHWHGLILPNNQDGVPFVTQPPIPSGGKYQYSFPIVQAGTFWMHAHFGLQEQKLLTAPLIFRDPSEKNADIQDIIMFLSDFSFRNPLEIFKELKSKGMKDMKSLNHENSVNNMAMQIDLNDVKYDAFLTNWRTLSDPEIVSIKPGKEVRLRVINGSSSSNFFIQLGNLKGEIIATDGADSQPFAASQFEIGIAQRLDVLIKIPEGQGAYPILAQGEGLQMRTGLVLATSNAQVPKIKEMADKPMGAMSYHQESLLKAKNSMPKRKVQRRLVVNLDGDMSKYIWTINGKTWPNNNEPLMVQQGERVEIVFINHTPMSHPMHLHGHVFQITEINEKPIEGALHDTILVLPQSIVKVQFDANNPGNWPFHCHNLYHQYAGMMTTLNYIEFKGLLFPRSEIEKMEYPSTK